MNIHGNFYGLKSKKKSLENLGTLDFHEIGQQALGYTLLLGKIHFYQKGIRNMNSTQKGNSN
jgi:hypothetical protein